MKTYSVSYRDEFTAEVKARNREEAIKKFENNKKVKIECIGECWEEYFEVLDEKGNEV